MSFSCMKPKHAQASSKQVSVLDGSLLVEQASEELEYSIGQSINDFREGHSTAVDFNDPKQVRDFFSL